MKAEWTNKDALVLSETTFVREQIIRCKDCKYYEIWEMKSGKDGYTDDKRHKPSVCTIGAFAVHRDENWFCADAERKTE